MKTDPGPEFWSLVAPHTGEVFDVHHSSRGFSSEVTAAVECESGPFFLKALRSPAGGRRKSIERERLINPHVRDVSPAVRWYVEDGGWYVLGFDVAEGGRWPRFEPDSADLTAVVQVLNRVSAIPCPTIAQDWAETRWNKWAGDEDEAKLFAGDALLYTDINPDNILLCDRTTWVVDWSWPTRGAAFIDPALFVVQLVAAGHDPQSAQGWGERCEAWDTAGPRALDAFAAANSRMLRSFAERMPEAEWHGAMADAGAEWAEFRGVKV